MPGGMTSLAALSAATIAYQPAINTGLSYAIKDGDTIISAFDQLQKNLAREQREFPHLTNHSPATLLFRSANFLRLADANKNITVRNGDVLSIDSDGNLKLQRANQTDTLIQAPARPKVETDRFTRVEDLTSQTQLARTLLQQINPSNLASIDGRSYREIETDMRKLQGLVCANVITREQVEQSLFGSHAINYAFALSDNAWNNRTGHAYIDRIAQREQPPRTLEQIHPLRANARERWMTIAAYQRVFGARLDTTTSSEPIEKFARNSELPRLQTLNDNHGGAIDLFFKKDRVTVEADGIQRGPRIRAMNAGVIIARGANWEAAHDEALSPVSGNGLITFTPEFDANGRYLGGRTTTYAHLYSLDENTCAGNLVQCGQSLGLGGNTGSARKVEIKDGKKIDHGYHLHLESHNINADGSHQSNSANQLHELISTAIQ